MIDVFGELPPEPFGRDVQKAREERPEFRRPEFRRPDTGDVSLYTTEA